MKKRRKKTQNREGKCFYFHRSNINCIVIAQTAEIVIQYPTIAMRPSICNQNWAQRNQWQKEMHFNNWNVTQTNWSLWMFDPPFFPPIRIQFSRRKWKRLEFHFQLDCLFFLASTSLFRPFSIFELGSCWAIKVHSIGGSCKYTRVKFESMCFFFLFHCFFWVFSILAAKIVVEMLFERTIGTDNVPLWQLNGKSLAASFKRPRFFASYVSTARNSRNHKITIHNMSIICVELVKSEMTKIKR